MRKPRVVVADDNRKVLSFISKVLIRQCDLVGEALDGEQAIDAALDLEPDILVLDIAMPRVNGIEVARRLVASGSAVKIVFLTALEEREYIEAALKLGVYGYVLKRLLRQDLPAAITAAAEGRTFYSAVPSHAPSASWPGLDKDPVTFDTDLSVQNESADPPGGNIFAPGDIAPLSGVYDAVHSQCALKRHYVLAIYGDVFPACLKCTSAVRFELRFSAVYVNAHPLFQREG